MSVFRQHNDLADRKLNVMSVFRQHNDLADRKLNVMSVPRVIFKLWSDFYIFVINQQQCDRVIL